MLVSDLPILAPKGLKIDRMGLQQHPAMHTKDLAGGGSVAAAVGIIAM